MNPVKFLRDCAPETMSKEMDPQTIKGLTSQEVFDRVKAGKVNDAHEQTSRALKDILRANIITRF